MPDEDEKNLAAVPASDSVPPDAPTVVTEFPQHLIDALAQVAGVSQPPIKSLPPVPPAPAPEAPAPKVLAPPRPPIDSQVTVEIPAAPPPSERLNLPSAIPDGATPATGSPQFDAALAGVAEEELDDIQLEPYESPESFRGGKNVSPSAAPPPPPAPPVVPAEKAVPARPLPEAAASAPPVSFTPPPSGIFGASKGGVVWAEPPPAVVLDPPSSALGWAIGGIVVGLLLLALLLWLLYYLVVRHFL